MIYIACVDKTIKGIDGPIDLKVGDEITVKKGFLYKGDHKICYEASQNAYDLFSRNDDGNGLKRFQTINDIKKTLRGYNAEYFSSVQKVRAEAGEKSSEEEINRSISSIENKARTAFNSLEKEGAVDAFVNPMTGVWNYDFYNANLSDLEAMLEIIESVEPSKEEIKEEVKN